MCAEVSGQHHYRRDALIARVTLSKNQCWPAALAKNASCHRFISSGASCSLRVAIAHCWPNGSVILPYRSPQKTSLQRHIDTRTAVNGTVENDVGVRHIKVDKHWVADSRLCAGSGSFGHLIVDEKLRVADLQFRVQDDSARARHAVDFRCPKYILVKINCACRVIGNEIRRN